MSHERGLSLHECPGSQNLAQSISKSDLIQDKLLKISNTKVQEYKESLIHLIRFIESLKAHAVCPICHFFMIGCVALSCGHFFCTHCIQLWLRHEDYCPLCQSTGKGEPKYRRIVSLDQSIERFYLCLEKLVGKKKSEDLTVNEFNNEESLPHLNSMTFDKMKLQVTNFKEGISPKMIWSKRLQEQVFASREKYINQISNIQPSIFEEFSFKLKVWFTKNIPDILCFIGIGIFCSLVAKYGTILLSKEVCSRIQEIICIILITLVCRKCYYLLLYQEEPRILEWFFQDVSPENTNRVLNGDPEVEMVEQLLMDDFPALTWEEIGSMLDDI